MLMGFQKGMTLKKNTAACWVSHMWLVKSLDCPMAPSLNPWLPWKSCSLRTLRSFTAPYLRIGPVNWTSCSDDFLKNKINGRPRRASSIQLTDRLDVLRGHFPLNHLSVALNCAASNPRILNHKTRHQQPVLFFRPDEIWWYSSRTDVHIYQVNTACLGTSCIHGWAMRKYWKIRLIDHG